MATQLQLRRGNTAQTAVFTGAIAEVTVDTDQKTVVVHDGTTVGGTYIITKAQLDSNVSILQGINNTQNTNITAINGFSASAYDTANGANGLAQSAFNAANTNSTNISIIQGVDLTQNNDIIAVNNYAQSAFAQANTNASNITAVNNFAVGAYDTANGANGMAVGAFAAANLAYSYTTQVQAIADAAYLTANNAFDAANGANGLAAGAYNTANGANGLAVSAYNEANTASSTATGANGLAQGAYNAANTNSTNIAIIQGVDLTQNTRLNAIETINSDQNTAITVIQGVDVTQNTRLNAIETININQNTAISIIQGVDVTQNNNITAVNNYAASAFNKANTGGTFTGNVIVQQNLTVDKDLVVTGNLIVTGNSTSVAANTLVIDDPMIVLANNNTLDVVDIGFIGHYGEITPGENYHTGVVRHAENNEYYIFYNYDKHIHASNNVIDITDPSFRKSNVNADYYKGNLIATTAVIGGTDIGSYISITQGVDNTQNTRLNAIETINTNQNTSIAVIQGVDLTQNTRLNAIETINTNQNTSITQVNQYAASAYAQANTNASNISIINGVDVTQNTRLNSIETINSTQNTTITAVNNFAASAFNRANNSVLKSGDTMTGSLTGVTTLGVTTIQFAQTDATTNTFTTASTAQVSVDAWPTASYRSAKYFVQITSGTSYHIIELNLVHNGTTVWLAQYGEIITGASLGTFDADISGATVRLLFTGTNAVSTVRVLRTVMDV